MEVVIMYDQEKKKSRGFGFLSFDSDAAVDRATADHFINLNGKQVEIKKAEPRDGSANHMMQVDPNQSIGSHWGGPMMGNGGPMSMGPMGMPNMNNPGFQQWNTSQSGYNYGSSTPSNPSFSAWPQQWGNNNYAVPPQAQQSQGYGAYDYGAYNSTGNYGNGGNWNSWNPNITNVPNTGSAGSSGDMYSRPQSGHNMHSAPPPPSGNISKPGSDYNGGAVAAAAATYNGAGAAYGNYYNEQQQQQQAPPQPFSNQNRPRSYGNNEQYPPF